MKPHTRLLFIAVDAGDKDLIIQWASEGILPTFRSLLDTSAVVHTTNPVGFVVGSVWPSFWTGLQPDSHGRYCYMQFRTGTYDHYNVTPTETQGEPFWDGLCENGCRVAIFDVPKTYPSKNLNGIQIVDWGTHDPEMGFCTSPESLADEIQRRFGVHPVDQCDEFMIRGPAEYASLRDQLVKGARRKGEVAAHFLERGGWDLFLTVFAEAHCVGHHCWHLHDRNHAAYDSGVSSFVGDPVRDVYVAIDTAIGDLIRRAGAGATVLVLASHGMGPHYDGTFLLDRILRNLLEPKAPPSKKAIARSLEAVWRAFPSPLKRLLKPLRGRAKEALGNAATNPEIASRVCFTTPNNDVYGGIRVNLAGREPSGLIQPGKEYDIFCESLTSDLLAFINVDTGKPIVRRVLRTRDLYTGDHVQDLPDLLIEWERSVPITRIHSPKTGMIEGVFPGIRSGDHKPDGLLLAKGPGIAPGEIPRTVDITHVGPTIASLLGVTLRSTSAEPIAEVAAAGGTVR